MSFLQAPNIDHALVLNVLVAFGLLANFIVGLMTRAAISDLKTWVMEFVDTTIEQRTVKIIDRQDRFDERLRGVEIRCASLHQISHTQEQE